MGQQAPTSSLQTALYQNYHHSALFLRNQDLFSSDVDKVVFRFSKSLSQIENRERDEMSRVK